MGRLEARERQPEVIEPMIEPLTRDRDAERSHVGEVGQADATRRVLLAEDYISVGAIESPPSGDAGRRRPSTWGKRAARGDLTTVGVPPPSVSRRPAAISSRDGEVLEGGGVWREGGWWRRGAAELGAARGHAPLWLR